MKLEPLFQLSYLQASDTFDSDNYADIKLWVKTAIADEDQKIREQLWKDERSPIFLYQERLRTIRLFRKYGENDPSLMRVANRLSFCKRGNRCCSGACPECGSLLQRSFVRKSKYLIRDRLDIDGHELVAITIVPAEPIIRLGNLHTLDIKNLLRRLGYALAKAGIDIAIGAIDFSFNEDKDGKYKPFWSAHYYVITSVANKAKIKKMLKRLFTSDRRIPRPVKISAFDNSSRRRSYAFKIQYNRRIGVDAIRKWKMAQLANAETHRDRDYELPSGWNYIRT